MYSARRARGFTLVELLAVIAIISILMSIVMVSISGSKAKSRDARRISDIRTIQLALAQYYNDNYMYPKNIYALTSAGAAPNNGLVGAYMPVVPYDPQISGVCTDGSQASCYRYIALTSGGSPACNSTTYIPNKYHIGAIFEEATNNELLRDVDAPVAGSGSMSGFQACTGSGTGDFNGLTVACTSTSNAADGCYDQTP